MERSLAVATPAPLRLGDYVTLTKPRIISLLVVTAFCAMVVGAHGFPSLSLTSNALGGLTLSIGGAHAVNMWYDRDIDRLMARTRNRPVPTGRIAPSEALSFGVFLGSASFVWLWFGVNHLTAELSLAGLLFYVLVYTIWLKRRSPQNIVIGGAAGSFPPLVGWAAVTGHLSWTAWMMFLVIFLWTPPHFWALALFKQDDYRKAHIPMMPVVRGPSATVRQMLIYAVALLIATLALYVLNPALGSIYLASATMLGLGFIAAIASLRRGRAGMEPRRVFFASLLYMAGLFVAMVAGALV